MKRINPMVNEVKKLFHPENLAFKETVEIFGNIAISKTLTYYKDDDSSNGKEIAKVEYVKSELGGNEGQSLYSDIMAGITVDNDVEERFDGRVKVFNCTELNVRQTLSRDNCDNRRFLNSYYYSDEDKRIYETDECEYIEDGTCNVELLEYDYDEDRIVEIRDVRGVAYGREPRKEFSKNDACRRVDDIALFNSGFYRVRPKYKYTFDYDENGVVSESAVIMPMGSAGAKALWSKYIYRTDTDVTLEEVIASFKEKSSIVTFPSTCLDYDDEGFENYFISDFVMSTQSVDKTPLIEVDGYVVACVDKLDFEDEHVEVVRYTPSGFKDRLTDGGRLRLEFNNRIGELQVNLCSNGNPNPTATLK